MPIDLETVWGQVRELEGRVDEHSHSMERIENRLEIIEDRLNHIDAKIDSQGASLRSEMNARFNTLQSTTIRLFTVTIGLLITSWLSILLTILYKH